jgi:hypothetical protein
MRFSQDNGPFDEVDWKRTCHVTFRVAIQRILPPLLRKPPVAVGYDAQMHGQPGIRSAFDSVQFRPQKPQPYPVHHRHAAIPKVRGENDRNPRQPRQGGQGRLQQVVQSARVTCPPEKKLSRVGFGRFGRAQDFLVDLDEGGEKRGDGGASEGEEAAGGEGGGQGSP